MATSTTGIRHTGHGPGLQFPQDRRHTHLYPSFLQRIDIVDGASLRMDRLHRKQHMGFGHGAHFCIGAVLARLEGALILTELLSRYPGFDVQAVGVEYAKSIFIRRLVKLELRIH